MPWRLDLLRGGAYPCFWRPLHLHLLVVMVVGLVGHDTWIRGWKLYAMKILWICATKVDLDLEDLVRLRKQDFGSWFKGRWGSVASYLWQVWRSDWVMPELRLLSVSWILTGVYHLGHELWHFGCRVESWSLSRALFCWRCSSGDIIFCSGRQFGFLSDFRNF